MPARLEVFDPAMCCSTGVCGPTSDPALARLAADLDWLARQGVTVARHNLSQEPQAFVANALVRGALDKGGVARLPIFVADGRVVVEGGYPDRTTLAAALGLAEKPLTADAQNADFCCCAPPVGESKPRVSKGGCC